MASLRWAWDGGGRRALLGLRACWRLLPGLAGRTLRGLSTWEHGEIGPSACLFLSPAWVSKAIGLGFVLRLHHALRV